MFPIFLPSSLLKKKYYIFYEYLLPIFTFLFSSFQAYEDVAKDGSPTIKLKFQLKEKNYIICQYNVLETLYEVY